MKESTTCFGPYWIGHYQVESRISENGHILQGVLHIKNRSGGNEILFNNSRDGVAM
jgi:hypothetical protein